MSLPHWRRGCPEIVQSPGAEQSNVYEVDLVGNLVRNCHCLDSKWESFFVVIALSSFEDSFSEVVMLSDSESSDDGHIVQLTINEHYAQAYKTKKEREELQKRS